MHTKEEKLAAFSRLLDTMDALREKCPWNAEQTMETIRPMTEEEVYELSDAIVKDDAPSIAKELGDLLYHIAFYCRIGEEQGRFDIADSLTKVCDKMEFRHPHVFGNDAGKHLSAKEIADTWELVKAKEKDGNKTVMSGIPDAMPAILKALSMRSGRHAERRVSLTKKRNSATCSSQSSMRHASTGWIRRRRSGPHAASSAAASPILRRTRYARGAGSLT